MKSNMTALHLIQTPVFYQTIIIATFFHSAIYLFVTKTQSQNFKSSLQKSWIITTIASFFLSLGSLSFVYQFIFNNFSLRNYAHLNTQFAVGLSTYFLSYLLSDLIIGVIFYKSQMKPMAGYFHHILYLVIVFNAIKWHVSGVFCLFAILELPTFILGLGILNKMLRNDSLFGLVFFLTRITFHLVLCERVYNGSIDLDSTIPKYLYLIPISVFPLHIAWFWGYMKQQYKANKTKIDEIKLKIKVKIEEKLVNMTPLDNEVKSRKVRVKSWVIKKVRQRFPVMNDVYLDSIENSQPSRNNKLVSLVA